MALQAIRGTQASGAQPQAQAMMRRATEHVAEVIDSAKDEEGQLTAHYLTEIGVERDGGTLNYDQFKMVARRMACLATVAVCFSGVGALPRWGGLRTPAV